MKKFSEAVKMILEVLDVKNDLGVHNAYHLCWFPSKKGDGLGVWCVMEVYPDELDKIDPKKCEIVY